MKTAKEQEEEKAQQEAGRDAARDEHNDRMANPRASLYGLEGNNLPPRAETATSTVMTNARKRNRL